MPSIIRRKTSGVAPSAFTVYAGDDPKPGGYRAVIKQINIGKSSSDNLMIQPVLELKAAAGSEKSKYDGYPVFPNVVLTDNESNMQREQAFYLAIGAKADADIVPEGAPEKFKAGDKQKCKIKTIGGINPVGKIVNVKLRMSPGSDEYPARLEADLIFAARSEAGQDDDTAEVDDIEDDIEDGEEDVELYEEDDLLKLGLPALRKILVDEFGEPKEDAAKIKVKAKLVEAILAAQEEEVEDDESDAEEADDEDDEVEEDAEEEDEEGDEDEDEDDAEAALREEFGALDRAGLKAAIKKRSPEAKFKTSQTDEDLLELAVELALQDPPF